MQTEMGGRYFPTLTTSRSTNRNITQVLLVLTEGHCANTQGEDEMPGLKCKRVKPHFVQRGRDAKWSRRLCKTCVCVVYYHTVCHHISITTLRDATLCWRAMPNALKVCFLLHRALQCTVYSARATLKARWVCIVVIFAGDDNWSSQLLLWFPVSYFSTFDATFTFDTLPVPQRFWWPTFEW